MNRSTLKRRLEEDILRPFPRQHEIKLDGLGSRHRIKIGASLATRRVTIGLFLESLPGYDPSLQGMISFYLTETEANDLKSQIESALDYIKGLDDEN